jgi:hypothetical protein
MLTRRALFQATAAAGITAAVGPAPAPAQDVLTFADLLRASEMLDAQNVPRFGGYTVFLQPDQYEEMALNSLTVNATYRVQETAWSLMRHERRRQEMGKRGRVTAAEVFARVSEGHDYPATVTIPAGVRVEVSAA